MLAEAYAYAIAENAGRFRHLSPPTADQKDAAFAVPINMLAAAFGTAALANLTVDTDDFVRRQELYRSARNPASRPRCLTRSMALRAAEKFLGVDAEFRNGKLFLGEREIPTRRATAI